MTQLRETELHGHRVAYRIAGSGPPVVLIHGVTSSSETWLPVLRLLSRDHTVLVPDLLGHGASAKPRGDYSMGAFASGVRDLMVSLGIDSATVVGHSLGGGVAMQFAYQFPDRAQRLALVGSGGLGRSVHPLLRAATLPGAEIVLPVIAATGLVEAGRSVGRALGRLGIRAGVEAAEAGRGYASLSDAEARSAFVHTLRASVDPGGQRVDARDRLYLAQSLPLLIVWGRRDAIIPVGHGIRAHELVPGSRLEIFEDAGHFPHCSEPERFTDLLREWMEATEPTDSDDERLRSLLRSGVPG